MTNETDTASDRAELSYFPAPDPIETGSYYGKAIWMFGAYKVAYPDGFVVLIPHTGFSATISEWPLPLDEPEVREGLLEMADGIRG